MNLDNLKEKYKNNAEFHQLVDTLTCFMAESRVTPQDVRDACFIAGIKLHDMMESTGKLDYWLHRDSISPKR